MDKPWVLTRHSKNNMNVLTFRAFFLNLFITVNCWSFALTFSPRLTLGALLAFCNHGWSATSNIRGIIQWCNTCYENQIDQSKRHKQNERMLKITKYLLSSQPILGIRIKHMSHKIFSTFRNFWPRISLEIYDRTKNCLGNTLFGFCICIDS